MLHGVELALCGKVSYPERMLWMSLMGSILMAGVAIIATLARRRGRDLGRLSPRWVEQHRSES